jgi:hypothetical protein
MLQLFCSREEGNLVGGLPIYKCSWLLRSDGDQPPRCTGAVLPDRSYHAPHGRTANPANADEVSLLAICNCLLAFWRVLNHQD